MDQELYRVRTICHRKAIALYFMVGIALACGLMVLLVLLGAGIVIGVIAGLSVGVLVGVFWPFRLWHFEWTEDSGDGPRIVVYP